ncbi:MAG: hypothetical protein FJZ79_08805 [Chlorobi bacterium]|nr:hypothetical protein [Chlorobiota bacterium]
MNSAYRSIVSCILILQVVMMPAFSITAVAAPPFDSLGSPVPVLPHSAGTAGGATAIPYSYQSGNYFTDTAGNILMNVNVWGNVERPGQVTVPEGADITTLISLAGGPTDDANIKKIRVNRAYPDENGKMSYLINLEKYAKQGDRSMLIALQPNDTIIIPRDRAIDFDFATILGILGVAISIYTVAED